MTPEEARKVSEIFMTADGNCPFCAYDLHHAAHEAFPEIDWKRFLLEEEIDIDEGDFRK